MFEKSRDYLAKPELYIPSTDPFWDDEHISKGMLEAHLNPHWDAATRKSDFLDMSVSWIASIAPPKQFHQLLDLGCGPGLYAERFNSVGYSVIGIDFSSRSIEYAKEQTQHNKSNIEYHYQNYLTIDHVEKFDVITLIYCDYAALSITDRLILLEKIHRALRPNGKFIFDVFTPKMRKKESRTWCYEEKGGFFCKEPYICLESIYQYDDYDETELRQSIVLNETEVHCYNIWDHFFTKEKLLSEAQPIGFGAYDFYGDVSGKKYSDAEETICCVFTK
ncbi:class I SAM-dependent methyltransferase [Scatolibacter rhodanostii]|uniref:class I SAM-dependent methyltransferase n=1 Tax=Scatolibacter rhodanostii TaxID=2014781 RepID=UPI000C07A375|nr:class I SAM-dependent methyltransferase [Scatolibacter rhodanostii]